MIRVAKSEGVRQLKLGEFECVLGPDDDDTEAIGFDVPGEGEREYEPEETRGRPLSMRVRYTGPRNGADKADNLRENISHPRKRRRRA